MLDVHDPDLDDDHFGRLQSSDAISQARALVKAIRLALASP